MGWLTIFLCYVGSFGLLSEQARGWTAPRPQHSPALENPAEFLRRQPRQTTGKEEQWVDASGVAALPSCADAYGYSTDCPFEVDWYYRNNLCTSDHSRARVDMACLCSANLTSNSCQRRCKPYVNRSIYLTWLNTTCVHATNWSGMLPGWERELVAPTDTAFSTLASTDEYRSFSFGNATIPPTGIFHAPSCMDDGTSCGATSILYGCSLTARDLELFVNPRSISIADNPFSDLDLPGAVDRGCACEALGRCGEWNCTGDAEVTQKLLWLNSACAGQPRWKGLPANWTAQLVLGQEPEYTRFNGTPRCMNASVATTRYFHDAISRCTSKRCVLDSWGLCSEVVDVKSTSCLCSSLDFNETASRDYCFWGWHTDRANYTLWLHDLCQNQTNWHGLPSNWERLLHFTLDDFIPWGWRVEPEITPWSLDRYNRDRTAWPIHHASCPSTSAKLGSFAAVNLVMALAIPLLGRRTVVKRLTFGVMGKRHSKWCFLLALVSVASHLLSNYVNAHLIRATPGFNHTPIAPLVFIWCTRPRLTWMAVLLLPIQPERSMYLSVATSSIVAELFLQLLGSAYLGIGGDFARRHKLYLVGHLQERGLGGSEDGMGRAAHLMFGGALLWLCTVTFSVLAIGWSALGINEVLGRLAKQVGGSSVDRKEERKAEQDARARGREVDRLEAGLGDYPKLFRSHVRDLLKRDGVTRDSEKYRKVIALVRSSTAWGQMTDPRSYQRRIQALLAEQGLPTITGLHPVSFQSYLATFRDDLARLHTEWPAILTVWRRLAYARRLEFRDVQKVAKQRRKKSKRAEAQQEWDRIVQRWSCAPSREVEDCRMRQADARACLAELGDARPAYRDNLVAAIVAWGDLATQWDDVVRRREGDKLDWRAPVTEAARKEVEREGAYVRVMQVVIFGMVFTWLAQWLWWAGFITLATDSYCPPKLVEITSVWSVFSLLGAVIGATA